MDLSERKETEQLTPSSPLGYLETLEKVLNCTEIVSLKPLCVQVQINNGHNCKRYLSKKLL